MPTLAEVRTYSLISVRSQARTLTTALAIALTMAGTGGAAFAECQPPPAPVRDLKLTRFYADKAGSVVDPKLAAAHKAETEPLTRFLRGVASDADKAWRRSKPEAQRDAAHCGLGALAQWAAAGALLGRMETAQAEYQRKWDLTGAALAYLKLRAHATPEQRAAIEPWLQKLADAARAFFDDPARKRNNHWYWLGLGLGAVGLATASDRHWEMARGIAADAARDITAEGTLPLEMERQARALHYHDFALEPLVLLAELARARGEDFWALGNGALHRLARATIDGFADPATFARLAGAPQEPGIKPGAGWSHVYAARFPGRLSAPIPGAAPGHRWLGGDTLVLMRVLAARG